MVFLRHELSLVTLGGYMQCLVCILHNMHPLPALPVVPQPEHFIILNFPSDQIRSADN